MRTRSTMLTGALCGALALTAHGALAADYPVLRGSQFDDPPPSREIETPFNWTGFYLGGTAGYTQSRFRTDKGVLDLANGVFNGTSVLGELSPAQLVLTQPRDDTGVTFGAFAGYNFAFGDAVIGFEGEYSRINHGTRASTLEARLVGSGGVAIASQQDAEIKDYANFRMRLGYAYGRLMPYFTFGAAAGRFDTNVAVAANWVNTANPPVSYFGYPRVLGGPKKDVWGYGMSLGGGIEAALVDNLTVRAEYLFTRFNNVEGVTVNLNTARVGAAVKF